MKHFKTFLFAIFLLIFSGCYTLKTNYQANTHVAINVDSDQYIIVGDIKGEAEMTYIYLFWAFIPIGDTKEYGTFDLPGGKSRMAGTTQSMAVYNAIQNSKLKYSKSNGVDAIITPKYTIKQSGFPPFYTKVYVEVEGKGIKFKTK